MQFHPTALFLSGIAYLALSVLFYSLHGDAEIMGGFFTAGTVAMMLWSCSRRED